VHKRPFSATLESPPSDSSRDLSGATDGGSGRAPIANALILDQRLRFTPTNIPALPICFAVAAVAAAAGTEPPASAVAPRRLEAISRPYLGVPYRLDCLGEAKPPDRDPLFTRKYVDCQTLVEQVLSEALAPHMGGLEAAGRLIRYHGGRPRIEDRYHYCIPDWLAGPWPARDVTAALGKVKLAAVTRKLNRPAFLRSRGGDPKLSPTPAITATARYVPRAGVPAVLDRIPDGSIAVFVSSNQATVAGHLGFLFRKDGRVILRHASQRQKRVVDQPLSAFMQAAPKSFIGLQVLQPDVAGLRRR
jgi:hypothetical protein